MKRTLYERKIISQLFWLYNNKNEDWVAKNMALELFEKIDKNQISLNEALGVNPEKFAKDFFEENSLSVKSPWERKV